MVQNFLRSEDRLALINHEIQFKYDEAIVSEVENLIQRTGIQAPLTQEKAIKLQKKFGKNIIATGKQVTWYTIFFSSLFHPFNILLTILAVGVGLSEDYESMGVMIFMVVISLIIRFVQEWKATRAAKSLRKLVSNTTCVIRYRNMNSLGAEDDSIDSQSSLPQTEHILTAKEIPLANVVPGDWVKLSAGDLIPADLILIESKDLFVSQSSLTGESIPVEKFVDPYYVGNDGAIGATIITLDASISYNNNKPKKPFRFKMRRFFRNLFGLQREYHPISPTNRPNGGGGRVNMDNPNNCYMGTSIVSGTGKGLVKATGNQTYFGNMAIELAEQKPQNAFQLGVRRISWIFFLTMFFLVPPILLIQGFVRGNWWEAFTFSLAVAVGLTPEMLPTIVSATSARGAFLMSKKKCIVKNLDSIINMGGMDVLCTDKTGTLTENQVVLMKHVDYYGRSSLFSIKLAFLNSGFQSGLKNLMDEAVIDFFHGNFYESTTSINARRVGSSSNPSRTNSQRFTSNSPLMNTFLKLDELPFDFIRRRMSVLLQAQSFNILISKGAVDEMLTICKYIYMPKEPENLADKEQDNTENLVVGSFEDLSAMGTFNIPSSKYLTELNPELLNNLIRMNNEYNEQGLRVIAVAYKLFPTIPQTLDKTHESEMIFAGFIAFQDPAKESTKPSIKSLLEHNIQIKVLTGDSAIVCRKICEDIHLPVTRIIESKDLEDATPEQILDMARNGTIFAKLTPLQKAEIVRSLKSNNHIVGFLGDGINDAAALTEADIGISVDNATDIAKDSADIILLEKDLTVICNGVQIGRRTYGNTLKYLVMAISSNFGNCFSILIASCSLRFKPMLPIHILTQNLLYDISQIAIPWDTVDEDFQLVPHRWSMKSVLRFMVCLGPWSSVFDITTFAYMYYDYGIDGPEKNVILFQTTWFTVGILTQTFIVHMIRTPKVPFIQSRPSWQLFVMTLAIIVVAVALPWIPYTRSLLKFCKIPVDIYPFIGLQLLAYCIVTQIVKMIYVKSMVLNL